MGLLVHLGDRSGHGLCRQLADAAMPMLSFFPRCRFGGPFAVRPHRVNQVQGPPVAGRRQGSPATSTRRSAADLTTPRCKDIVRRPLPPLSPPHPGRKDSGCSGAARPPFTRRSSAESAEGWGHRRSDVGGGGRPAEPKPGRPGRVTPPAPCTYCLCTCSCSYSYQVFGYVLVDALVCFPVSVEQHFQPEKPPLSK